MARFTLKMRNVTIGWSELEKQDASMGAASGVFRPGPGYELVQPVFRLFAEAQGDGRAETADHARLTRYYAARDRLGLSLHTLDGTVIPTEVIHIVDFTAEHGPDALELHVATASSKGGRVSRLGGAQDGSSC